MTVPRDERKEEGDRAQTTEDDPAWTSSVQMSVAQSVGDTPEIPGPHAPHIYINESSPFV